MEFQRPIRVLMLESHPPNVQVMKETLELAGLPAQVTSVSSSEEVLYAAEDASLDIALLNLEPPDIDAAIVDELRSLDGAKRLPIIAFSDELPENADHVFPKPEHEAEYMGIVAAIRFYWMSAAPSLPPPPPRPQLLDFGPEEEEVVQEDGTRPQRLSQVDLMGMHIEPVEAYLLSMVDGSMDVDEISLSIGAEVKETRAMLRRLAGLGVVSWRAPHPSMAPPPPPSITPPAPLSAPPAPDDGFGEPMSIADFLAEERDAQQARDKLDEATSEKAPELELVEEPAPELERVEEPVASLQEVKAESAAPAQAAEPAKAKDAPERKVFSDDVRKKSIDDAHALLGEADYYELLGVPRDAEKKQIRTEYFKLAKLFHTDSLYGVELEEYGPKMDRVFQAITEAYEVLSKKKKRRAYDAYLGAVNETETLEAPRHSNPPARPSLVPKALVIPRVSASAIPEAIPEASATPQASVIPSAIPQASVIPKAPSDAPPPRDAEPTNAQPQEPPTKAICTPAEAAGTRRDIAKKLLARRTGRHARPPSEPTSQGQAAAEAVAEAAPRVRKKDRADRLIDDARIAEEKGNITGAAEALRIASAWRPHDTALAKDAERLRHAALVEKAPAFAKRARYAERNGNWEEAATCWSRVADVRPDDATAAKSAAAAIVQARGDMRIAADYAKRSVELAPRDAQCHRVLGEVWIAAGMPRSAKRCLETVLKLAPQDEKAAALLEGLRS